MSVFRFASIMTLATFVAEFGITQVSDDQNLGVSAAWSAVADGLLLALAVLVLHRGVSWIADYREGRLSNPRPVSGSLTVSVLAFTFELTLHDLVEHFEISAGPLAGSLADAALVCLAVGIGSAWIAFVDQRVRSMTTKKLDARKLIQGTLLAGITFAAACIAILPALTAIDANMRWQAHEPATDISNLAGRQRMLSQRIGRLALLEGNAAAFDLRTTIEAAETQSLQLNGLITDYRQMSPVAFAQVENLPGSVALERLRSVYLSNARSVADQRPGPVSARDMLALQSSIDAFLPEMEIAANTFADLDRAIVASQRDRELLRSTLGSVVMFALSFGLVWPILRLTGAQQVQLSDQAEIVRLTRNPIIRADAQGLITWVNPAFESLTGYRLDEVIGLKPGSFLQCDDTDPATVARISEALRNGLPSAETVINRSKDGRVYWLHLDIQPIRSADGRLTGFQSVQTDVTVNIQASQREAEAHARLSSFIDVTLSPICICNLDGMFIMVNGVFASQLGYAVSDMEGRLANEFIHPEDQAANLNVLQQFRHDYPVQNFINRYRGKNGSYRHFEWRASLNDNLVYAAAHDITSRLEYEALLKSERAEAQAATKAKSQFLANMSHEIRTPLNGVIGLTDALRRTSLDVQQTEMVELVQRSGLTLERLLSDILDMSKIEAGKFQLQNEPFDLVQSIETAAQVMRIRADDKGVDFEVKYCKGAGGLFLADAVRVRQIVSNLTSNAVKFTEKGKITVDVSVSEPAVGPAVIRISVSDTGIGFDAETRKRLFSRFEQADGSITRTYGGTGLGLAISRSLAEAMGGNIQVRSQLGKGSTFIAQLKAMRVQEAAPNAAEPSARRLADEAGPAHALRVLLAEDHPVNQKVVSLILAPFGVDLAIANNGLEALEAFSRNAYDIVLMDMQMPEMDGLAATIAIRQIEQDKNLRRTPVAMLSANAMAEHVKMALEAGADIHIAKPVTANHLIDCITKLCAQSASDGEVAPVSVLAV